eukprot:TRINITY_DN25596_c0_g2_i1.p1 TRINITY_DN25596_c0_g2~~TRINITY_DN25596_c0_g2_i1.p1  ORF type:complete len:890 (+),score=82.86 TRINITY_DN25596_c0_g2_i1:144-2813(+)
MCDAVFDVPSLALVEKLVRSAAGLSSNRELHVSFPNTISKQAEAISFAKDLVDKNQFAEHELGLFARDLGSTGAKTFFVDTFAGLALASASKISPCLWEAAYRKISPPALSMHEKTRHRQHLYEVIGDGRPCWLYFDLEFNRSANPSRNVDKVAQDFFLAFDRFCISKLGSPYDPDAVIDLDCTTPQKFSKHVIVKRLASGQALAFETNAHAGALVNQFLDFLREEKDESSCDDRGLFFNDGKGTVDERGSQVSLVDGCVYSRNRCFRLLFSSKYGKTEQLRMAGGDTYSMLPPLQLLSSLASFVPAGTKTFDHPLCNLSGTEGRLSCLKSKSDDTRQNAQTTKQLGGVRSSCMHVALQTGCPWFELFEYLVSHWDTVRSERENITTQSKTRVQSSVLVGNGRYLCVTLANNRFCYRKGCSHKSNSIYIVVDVVRSVFYQKCHDVADCGRDFRSEESALPRGLISAESDIQDEPLAAEMEQKELSQVVEETQIILSQAANIHEGTLDPQLFQDESVREDTLEAITQTLRLSGSRHDVVVKLEHKGLQSLNIATQTWHASLYYAPTLPDKLGDALEPSGTQASAVTMRTLPCSSSPPRTPPCKRRLDLAIPDQAEAIEPTAPQICPDLPLSFSMMPTQVCTQTQHDRRFSAMNEQPEVCPDDGTRCTDMTVVDSESELGCVSAAEDTDVETRSTPQNADESNRPPMFARSIMDEMFEDSPGNMAFHSQTQKTVIDQLLDSQDGRQDANAETRLDQLSSQLVRSDHVDEPLRNSSERREDDLAAKTRLDRLSSQFFRTDEIDEQDSISSWTDTPPDQPRKANNKRVCHSFRRNLKGAAVSSPGSATSANSNSPCGFSSSVSTEDPAVYRRRNGSYKRRKVGRCILQPSCTR